MTKYNHSLEEFKADWRKWQVKILRLLEKEASSIVTKEDLTGLFLLAISICSYFITWSTYTFADDHGIQCVYLLEKKLYARSQKDKKSIIITADVS